MGDTHDVTLGRRLGEFVLLDRLDEGGFGAVYRCEQPLLSREAVVKVLHERARTDEAALARFAREAQLASRLDHPYAAHVYAFGIESDGVVWIAMELVRGITLAERLKARGPIPLDQFVPFFERVCEVVQAAHEQGIVHRDLKPHNIMVIERAGRLVPKLLDFGVAKMRDEVTPLRPPESGPEHDDSVTTPARCDDLTPTGAAPGTPAYMAPELWLGLESGIAADIYALGVIAFECLTGRKPFRASPSETPDAGEVIRRLGCQHCTAEIPTVGGSLPAGLDAVFARALAKDAGERYGSALDFATALRAEADAQLVAQIRTAARAWERRDRPSGLLWRDETLAELERWHRRTSRAGLTSTEIEFVEASRAAGERAATESERRRRRAWRIGAVAAGVAVLGIVGVFQWSARYEARIAQQRAADAAERERAVTVSAEVEQGRAALLHDDLAEAQRHLSEAWAKGERSGGTAFMYARALQPLRAELAKLDGTGRMWSASWSPDGTRIVTTDDHGAQVWDAATYARLSPLPHRDVVYSAVWTGAEVVTACGDGSVRMWDAARGDMVRELRLPGRTPRWYALAVSGSTVAAVDAKGAVAAVWDTSGTLLAEMTPDSRSRPSVAFSADGRWLAVSGGGAAEVYDTTTWQPAATMDDQVRALAWDPTGPRLLTGSTSGTAAIWSMQNESRLPFDLGEAVGTVAYSNDGRHAAIAGDNGAVHVVDTASGRIVSQSNRLRARVVSVTFSVDGRQVAAASTSGELSISDAASGLPVALLEGPQQQLRGAAFSVDGLRVLAASADGAARVWSTGSPYRRWSAERQADACGLVGGVEPDGRYQAVSCEGHPTRVWDTARDELLAELPPVTGAERVPYPVVSARGDRAAIARGSEVEVYELPGGRLIRMVRHRGVATALAFDAAGALVSGSADGAVLVDGSVTLTGDASIDALVALPGGRIAAADASGRVRIAGREIDAGIRARMLRLSPDGRRLLVVAYYSERAEPMVIVDLEHGTTVRLDGPAAYAARWTSAGILSAHADGAARLWDADGALKQTYRGGTRFLADADLSADGSIVVAGGGAGLLRFWDAASGRPLWVVAAHRPYVMGLHFEQSGLDIVTRGTGGEVARWHLPDAQNVISGL